MFAACDAELKWLLVWWGQVILIDPGDLMKAAGLLMGGSVMGAPFPCYNAHFSYIAQVRSPTSPHPLPRFHVLTHSP